MGGMFVIEQFKVYNRSKISILYEIMQTMCPPVSYLDCSSTTCAVEKLCFFQGTSGSRTPRTGNGTL